MTTLVTGATGLVGGAVVRALCEGGERVRVLVRDGSSREGLSGLDFEEARGDVRHLDALKSAMKGCERVVHAAASVRLDPFAAKYMEAVNVGGTKNVLAAAKATYVERLVHVSSIVAVGGGTLDRPADETASWALAHKGPYFSTKRAAEELVLESARRGDVEAVVVNPSFVMGAFDVKPSSGAVISAVASGLVVGYPAGGTGFVGARDVADGVRLAFEKGVSGERYVLSAENLTYRQFLTLVAEELGVKPPSLFVPKGLTLSLARVGDRLGPRFPEVFALFNRRVMETAYETSYVSSAKARSALGWSPRPFREAVREACRWMVETGRVQRAA